MKIHIKNMVAQGTRRFVLMELKKLGFKLRSFESAEMEFENELLPAETSAIEKSLSKYGLEIFSEDPEQYSDINLDNSSENTDNQVGVPGEIMEVAEVGQTN